MSNQDPNDDEVLENGSPELILHFISAQIESQDSRAKCIDTLDLLEPTLYSYCNVDSSQALYVVLKINGDFTIFSELVDVVPQDTVLITIFLKHSRILRSVDSLQSQINVLCLPVDDSYVSRVTRSPILVRDLLNHVVTPYFDRLSSSEADKNASGSLQLARKKLSELNASLNYVDLQIEVPDLLSSVLPSVLELLRQPQEEEELLQNTTLLNELTHNANNWIKQILSVTRTSKSPSENWSISDEISFWASMETALVSLQEQVQQPEVQKLMQILVASKRYQTTFKFQNNLQISEKLEEVKLYNAFLKELPIDGLAISKDSTDPLSDFDSNLSLVFGQLKKWKSLTSFPLLRMIELIELILSDVSNNFTSVLSSLSLMALPEEPFLNIVNTKVKSILRAIDNFIKNMTNILREVMRKRLEKFMIIKIDQDRIDRIEKRIDGLIELKGKHHSLSRGLLQSGADEVLVDQLMKAYNKHVIAPNHFDINPDGVLIWAAQEDSYLETHNRILANLALSLNSKIAMCTSYDDFVSFLGNIEKSNTGSSMLLPLIDDNHKVRFLTKVQDIMKDLLSTANNQCRIDNLKLSSKPSLDLIDEILFKISLKSNVDIVIRTIGQSLGDSWELFAIGAQIKDVISSLADRLDVGNNLDAWIVSTRSQLEYLNKGESIFRFQESEENGELVLILDIPAEVLEMPRNISLLKSFGLSLPSDLTLQESRINVTKSIVFTLHEHIEVFNQALFETCSRSGFEQVFEPIKEEALGLLLEISSYSWSNLRLDAIYMTEGSEQSETEVESMKLIHQFQEVTYNLFDVRRSVDNFLKSIDSDYLPALRSCEFNLSSIQQCVDLIRDAAFHFMQRISNYRLFDAVLRDLIAKGIFEKCEKQLCQFSTAIKEETDGFSKYKAHHTLYLENGEFFIEPPIASSRDSWTGIVSNWTSIISLLTFEDSTGAHQRLFLQFPSFIKDQVQETLSEIDTLFTSVDQEMYHWSEFGEALKLNLKDNPFKDLPVEEMLIKLKHLLQLGSRLEDSRGVIKLGGLLDILYSVVRNQILSSYGEFKSQLINRFTQAVSDSSRSLLGQMKETERRLGYEPNLLQPFRANLDFMAHLFASKDNVAQWTGFQTSINDCQKLLHQSKRQLPGYWIYPDQFEHTISNLQLLINRKMSFVDENLDRFQTSLSKEMSCCNDDYEEMANEWFSKRPISGSMEPGHALSILTKLTKKLNDLDQYRGKVVEVSQKLGVAIPSLVLYQSLKDELDDMNFVWKSLEELWDIIEVINEMRWSDANPREVKQQLEGLSKTMKSLPAMVRHYSAFTILKNKVASFINQLTILHELKGASLKPRHWKKILTAVNSPPALSYENMKLRHMFDLGFQIHEGSIKAILKQANDERIVEESLDGIEKEMSTVVFETFDYNGKCRLVRNWGKLFDVCQANIGTLSSMKNLVSHGEFEERRSALENKLFDLESIFDTWVEVQKHWAYLDGVFGNNPDIRSSLPTESTRFNNLSFEFINVLKRISKFTVVIDILSIKSLRETFQRIEESLERTKKGLTNYLEKQRLLFPRFYFLGNEDMLELIGGSNDINKVNRHVKLMFFGVESLIKDKDTNSITYIISPEGERLKLSQPVSLIRAQELHEWLSELESQMRLTVALLVKHAIQELQSSFLGGSFENGSISDIIERFPTQVLVVALNVMFTRQTVKMSEKDYSLAADYEKLLRKVASLLDSSRSLHEAKKIESLVIELTHHREIAGKLDSAPLSQRSSILNQVQLFDFNSEAASPLDSVTVRQGRFELPYGFEYQGIVERLVVTPLVDRCYLAMSLVLAQGLGGSPFGPAGTGKTESVKALGYSLGRMVKVFNCDDSFDYKSIERILLGLCKVGCWGCFDEFNRLDSANLSALASQVEAIQRGLNNYSDHHQVELSGNSFSIHPNTGLFVTMNPGYAGRNELPENMKRLFRSFSMERPDLEMIIDVILTSQQLVHTKSLSEKLVDFFKGLEDATSRQIHYDFGLRAIKSILRMCGVKRQHAGSKSEQDPQLRDELILVARCLEESLLPKLVPEDIPRFQGLLTKIFDAKGDPSSEFEAFYDRVQTSAAKEGFTVSEALLQKCSQILLILESHHGFMLVGESGSGKSTMLRQVLNAKSELEGTSHRTFVLDCKVLSKEQIFGSLDPITREWTDGILTSHLRSIVQNMKGEQAHRSWIVFDGDIDPEWAENLNSVLDDNKILTLPNGERLELPQNVRIVFEVDNLNHATLATITRCGMIWFDRSLIKSGMLYKRFLYDLNHKALEVDVNQDGQIIDYEILLIQKQIVTIAEAYDDALFDDVFRKSSGLDHIMKHTAQRALNSVLTFFEAQIAKLLTFKIKNPTIVWESLNDFVKKAIFLSLVWAYSGDSPTTQRNSFIGQLAEIGDFRLLDIPENLTEYFISPIDFQWSPWLQHIELLDLDPHHVMDPGTIVPTVDTVIHEDLIYSLVNKHSPLLLCGPPGSGKTMTFLKALRKLPSLDMISLNFSKDTTPETLITLLEQHCCYKRSNEGLVLAPRVDGKWTVVFCDEINLPSLDKYGTQKVISLMRLMVERRGFWSFRHKEWITLENIQFVGACNDPSDPGRHQLSERFLRHVCVVMVDYPGKNSMMQIYESFNNAALKCAPDLRGFAKPLTAAMLEVYTKSKENLTPAIQSHYVYSPRELTRWCRGILETIIQSSYEDITALIRLWYHEGLRLFYDRLSGENERQWTKTLLTETAANHFPHTDLDQAFKEPVLYSKWLTSSYEPVPVDELTSFVHERCRVFSEEELEVDLILFEDMLDQTLRIDRVLRQHQGHMILVGPCTSGKSTLTKFVAWMNGIKVVQMNVRKGYSIQDFQQKLREILLSCLKGEKICFLIDESSLLETAFIERMNTLLANSEVPGLFEGDDFASLIKQCASESAAQGYLLDSDEELYAWFTDQVSTNLHVVFTLSDVGSDKRVQVNSSPALFNRCVLNWMGDWDQKSLVEIANKKLQEIPLDGSSYAPPSDGSDNVRSFHDAVVKVCVSIHQSIKSYPLQFLNFLLLTTKLYNQKELELNLNQRHIIVGLDKLKETVLEVSEMRKVLSEKQESLQAKETDAKNMLDKMIVNQNEAERKREFSVATQGELEKQEVQINKRRDVVMQELEVAEPAVLEAQRGVQNIKKQHLTELRSMSNPPAAVKMALESVCILLGYDVRTWRDVQLVVRKDDFIASIVSYDSEIQLTPELSDYMDKTYLNRPDFTYDTVNRASKACGPLLQWVIAQLKYYSILERVMPLKEEVTMLQAAAKKSKAQLMAIAEMIQELEDSIVDYKKKYSEIIREAERVRVEMETIERKVQRSEDLIKNLTSERVRWELNIKLCDEERLRIAGNSILSAAFATYCGRLDQASRDAFFKTWKKKMGELGISFHEFISPVAVLASTKQMADWAHLGLPRDDLYEQNFAIKQWSEFVFVIDPLGDVLDALASSSPGKKVEQTSFLDSSFMRHVEDAMRFGGTILITHAELYDPIMDPILRREFSHTGGRRLVQLEKRGVDILPDFRVIFLSKDHAALLPSSFASRVNVLNFTTTSSNVKSQTLDLCLERVHPDTYGKQKEITRLQSDYQERSRFLRQQLLDTLNNVAGTILDNDEATDTLQAIHFESQVLDEKFSESNTTLQEVDNIRGQFLEIAEHLSGVHDILRNLSSMSEFYSFSFKTLVEILNGILETHLNGDAMGNIIPQFYCAVFAEVAPALRNLEQVVLALALSVSYFEVTEGASMSQVIRDVINLVGCKDNKSRLSEILKQRSLLDKGSDLSLQMWEQIENEAKSSALSAMSAFVHKIFGSDISWLDAMLSFTTSVFGTPFGQIKKYALADWVSLETSPILIAESDHIDSTPQIERLAKERNVKVKVIAMGTSEGTKTALKELETALKNGSWVVLQNVHLSGSWLNGVEQLIDKRKAHSAFSLFMTCLLTAENIPPALLFKSKVLTYEETPTFKTVLFDSLKYLWSQSVSLMPVAKTVLFLVSWYHAVIQENLKFVPNAFSQKYHISEVDLMSTAAYLKNVFSSFEGKAVVRVEDLPWHELLSILGSVIYGGKVSIEKDAIFCQKLALELFHEKCCDDDFLLPNSSLNIPVDGGPDAYEEWINALPESVPPQWVGLSDDAMTETLENDAARISQIAAAITK